MNNIDFSQWTSFGKDGWIKCRQNRSYTNPYPESELDVKLEPVGQTQIVPIDIAAENVARDIASLYTNIFVAMSGGIDSEFIAKTFHRLGIPFTPLIVQIDDLNEADIWWAYKWCKDNNVTPVTISKTAAETMRRVIDISVTTCSRFGIGLSVMSFLNEYVTSANGTLVTGAGFIEYFPDSNLDYMTSRYTDSKVHNDQQQIAGYIMHEPDVLQSKLWPNQPFNFLSWTPEIVLSYIAERDMTMNSEENKTRIFSCSPRPKNIGIHGFYFAKSPLIAHWGLLRQDIGTTECEYLGTSEELMNILLNTNSST